VNMGTVAESTVLTIGDPCATAVTTEGILDEGQCLETDHTPAVDSSTDENIPKKNGSSSDKHRIRYTKDFIIECFRHPACARKPIFELPNLSCILAVARFGATPFTTLYVPPRRKDENGRKEPEDNISLRPHSGNFSSGCAPNLSPSHYPQGQFSRFQFHHEDATKYPYDRGYSRNYRFNSNGRPDAERPERIRLERDREDPRDRRDRDRDVDKRDVRRDTRHPNQNRRQNSILWGPDSENQPEWTRRGGGKEGRGGRPYGKDKYGGFRDHEEESEPSWFSEGPTSQHDTIELHGFQDDERLQREQHGLLSRESAQNRASRTSEEDTNAESARISSNNKAGEHPVSVSSSETKQSELELSLEKILTMDRISGFLPNGLFEESEQPSGSSRFSQIFHRNKSSSVAPRSEPPPPSHEQHEEKPNRASGGVSLQDLFGSKPEPNSSESKADVVKGMETQLRQILLGGKEMQEPPKEQSKQEDLNAFKKLLEDLVIKSNKTGPQKVENQPDNGSGRPFPGPPPGLQGIPFNPFALGSAPTQSRPPQQFNNIVPPMPMNQMAPSHPLSRLMEQQQHHQQQEAATMQSQKRSGTPILAALTPTAVMRKMTADQQPKTGASIANPVTSSYSGIPASVQSAFTSTNNISSGNVPRQQLNPLSSFVSAMAQNQSQHLAQPQALPPQVNHAGPGHRPPPHPGHVPVGSFPGYPPMHPQQRGPFPMVPNNGIPQPFNPYGVPFYNNGPMQHRK